MATFKVGQRVRIIGPASNPGREHLIGLETTIIDGPDEWGMYSVALIDDRFNAPGHCLSRNLAPLTDPRASEFIADMERFSKVTKVPA